MSYFSPAKPDRNVSKPQTAAAPEPRIDAGRTTASTTNKPQEAVSTIGSGMLITGNIVSTGAVQVFGRVIGDIHAARLVICDGAHVEGKVMAQEAVIDGTFKGTIHANAVKLQATAHVDGEVYNKSLTIEQNAQFEGVARRLDKAVDAPSAAQTKPEPTAPYAPAPTQAYAPAAAASYAPPVMDADVLQLPTTQGFSANTNDRPTWTR